LELGYLLAFIGLKNSGLILSNQYTLLQFIDFNNMANWQLGGTACTAIVALFGLIVIAVLSHYKVKGSVVIGILSATLLAIPLKVADLNILFGNDTGITWKFWENFSNFFNFNPDQGGVFMSLFTEGLNFPEGSIFTVLMVVLTFIILDLFDTIGTVVGCSTNAGLIDEDGKPHDYNKIMYSDSISSCAGALVGTSTVSIFVESGAGIASGGKTGLTALTIAILFLLSIFVLPIFAFIPISAASSALIYVGVLMIKKC
jgi:AGZA family xanthine/uracil permease-like MFS transporter